MWEVWEVWGVWEQRRDLVRLYWGVWEVWGVWELLPIPCSQQSHSTGIVMII